VSGKAHDFRFLLRIRLLDCAAINKLLLSSVVALLLISLIPVSPKSQSQVTSPVTEPPGSTSGAPASKACPKVTKVAAREQSARFAKLIAAAKSGKLVEKFPEKTIVRQPRLHMEMGQHNHSITRVPPIASLPTDAKIQADFGHLVSGSDGVDDPREEVESKNVTVEAWIY
jgi:hypothetical protein